MNGKRRRIGRRSTGSLGFRFVPDAVSFTRGEILDIKPLNPPLKYRDQIVGYIRAYEQITGQLPTRIIIEYYDPATGAMRQPSRYPPEFFLRGRSP